MASGKILTVPFALWAGKKVLALWWVWTGGRVRVIRHKVVWPRANESTKLVHLTKVEDWDVAINIANGVHYLTASVDTLSSHTTYVTLIAKYLLCQFSVDLLLARAHDVTTSMYLSIACHFPCQLARAQMCQLQLMRPNALPRFPSTHCWTWLSAYWAPLLLLATEFYGKWLKMFYKNDLRRLVIEKALSIGYI